MNSFCWCLTCIFSPRTICKMFKKNSKIFKANQASCLFAFFCLSCHKQSYPFLSCQNSKALIFSIMSDISFLTFPLKVNEVGTYSLIQELLQIVSTNLLFSVCLKMSIPYDLYIQTALVICDR